MKQKLGGLLLKIRQNRKLAIILIGVAGVVVIGIVYGLLLARPPSSANVQTQKGTATQPTQAANKKQAFRQSRGPANAGPCSDGPLFNHLPMALADFRSFRPLGFVTQPTHIFGAKHSSFTINLPHESKKGLKVVFPSDALVTAIISTESKRSAGYQMTFYPCSDFKSYFFHLGTISERLQREIKGGKATCQNVGTGENLIKKCQVDIEVKVESGELAGTNDGFAGVDFGAVDYRLPPAQYANLKRYDGDYPHYTSPILYFTPTLKSQLESKLRSIDGAVLRTAEPKVGTLLQDIKGTAQGNWFIGDKSFNNSQDFSPFLALLHDYIDPLQPLFSMGTSVKGLNMGLYGFKPRGSGVINRDFKDIKPDGSTYCFDSFLTGKTVGGLNLSAVSGAIIMAMPDESKLKVEKIGQAGSSCVNTTLAFSSAATIFDR
ncbi:MAG TPA: hypothetical protein VJ836_01920 [Candidatus Saccharimonadales bacterium]|nr:hypothetical protein [Candidatus Saccharimonadales bacterium]